MARQGIFTGSSPNDGTGDSLVVGAVKVNQNFSEIYNTFGNGTTLVSYVNNAGVASVSQGLSGTPNINVGILTASQFNLTQGEIRVGFNSDFVISVEDVESESTYTFSSSGIAYFPANINIGPNGYILFNNQGSQIQADPSYDFVLHVGGFGNKVWGFGTSGYLTFPDSTVQRTAFVGYANTAGIATVAQGLTGTPNLNVGVVTATSFIGDGSGLTGLVASGTGIVIKDSSTLVGTAGTIDFGNNLTVSPASAGVVTVTATGGIATETDPVFTSSVAFGISSTNISNWNTAYSWGNHASAGYATSSFVNSLTLNQLADVNAGGPSTGQVLKWSGTEWEAASDLTASGGAGIGLSDLSVTITSAGINSLTYNNTTGVFLFTPASFVGYATTGYVITQIGLNTFTGVASTITTTNISNWNTAYSWGNHASAGYLTNVNITAGSNITVLEISEGNFIITSTSIAGAGGTWSTNALGIHTTKNVGIGTTLSSSALTVEGDGRFSGVVTATRFQSTSAGTPTIDSPNNLNINAVTVAISTDVTVGRQLSVTGITTINGGGIGVAGVVTATSFVGSLTGNVTGNLTGTASTATAAATAYALVGSVGSASTASFATTSYGLTGTPNITVESITASQINVSGVSTFAGITTVTDATLFVKSIDGTGNSRFSGVSTATSFRTNSTVGDGTDVGFAIKYYITSSGFSAYRFAGPGIVNTADNPTIYLHRGFTYIFENSTGGSHPFAIRYSSGGTGYGSTYLSGSQSGTQVFTVPFDAPATLVYQCTIHSGMLGTFNIVS